MMDATDPAAAGQDELARPTRPGHEHPELDSVVRAIADELAERLDRALTAW
jgi:hypothetical protein